MTRSMRVTRGGGRNSVGALAYHPTFVLLGTLVGLVALALLTADVLWQGPLIAWDNQVADALHTWAVASPAWLTSLMRLGSGIGFYGVLAVVVGFAILFIARHRWRELSLLLLTAVGGQLVFDAFAALVHRPRPHFGNAFEGLTANSFPSGHVTSSLLLFGLLLYIFVPRIRAGAVRVLLVLAGLLLVAWIAFSRLYLGSHFPTDVIAGVALAMAWGLLTAGALESYWRDRSRAWARSASKRIIERSGMGTSETTSSGNTRKPG
jgi:membrane-associated phospholipid phosphatase